MDSSEEKYFYKYFIEKEIKNEVETVRKEDKTRMLNMISAKLRSLAKKTNSERYMAMLHSLNELLKDAYLLDMYKQQFQLFTLSMNKELKSIEEYIINEPEL